MNTFFIKILVFTTFLASFTYSKYDGYKLLCLKEKLSDSSANRVLLDIIDLQILDIDFIDSRHLLVPHGVADVLAEAGVRFESRNADEIFDSATVRGENTKANWFSKETKHKRYAKKFSRNNTEKEIKDFCAKYIASNDMFDKSQFVDENIVYKKIHDYLMILKWLKTMEKKYPKLIKVQKYGESYEGKCLVYAEVNSGRDVVMADGGIHSREWGSISSVLILLHKLVHSLRIGDVLLEDFTFIIIPVYNPDGYQFSHQKERLWRKSRAPTIDKDCFGVDLNRNFAVGWDKCQKDRLNSKIYNVFYSQAHETTHSTSLSVRLKNITKRATKKIKSDHFYCSSTYKGKHSNSEPETRAFSKLVSRYKVVAHFNVHTYGNMWLHPYGHVDQVVPLNHDKSMEAAMEAVRIIEEEHGVTMALGSVSELVRYQACGSMMDWIVDYTKATYVYSLELTPSQIDDEEMWSDQIRNMFDIRDKDIKKYGDVLYTGVKTILMYVEPRT